MSYKSYYKKSYANRAGLVADIWTNLVAMGWELHDNQDGSSYRVYKTNAESADRIYQYMKIDWITANKIHTPTNSKSITGP